MKKSGFSAKGGSYFVMVRPLQRDVKLREGHPELWAWMEANVGKPNEDWTWNWQNNVPRGEPKYYRLHIYNRGDDEAVKRLAMRCKLTWGGI